MEPFIVFGICCLAILFVSGVLNGAYDQLVYHKSTISSESRMPPQKWSSQKILKWIAIAFTWGMTLASMGNIIWLIVMGNLEYCINFFVGGIICLLIGLTVGMAIIDGFIKSACKEHGIDFMPRCL